MTQMKRIDTDKISENPPNPCHLRSIVYKLQVDSKLPQLFDSLVCEPISDILLKPVPKGKPESGIFNR